ncbi:Cytochrome P450 [Macleaya cordata]|uniref:Cytochrome P450 n=1 Tax=Macleaya cordata TaxID=56857 RepID=A0A200QK53_MACCD|nr:Cytochrome P450 [Macleaya cordata]
MVVGGLPVLVEIRRWFAVLSFNVVVRMLAGKRYFGRRTETDCDEEETRRYQKAMSDFMLLVGIFVVSDAIPFLGFLDLQGYVKEMKRTAVEIDYASGRWVDEHRRRRRDWKKINNKVDDDDQQEDFIDVMLSIMKDEEEFFGYDADTVIKSTCLSLILGGNETTSVTLTWALSLLLNNRQVLQKAQDELDIHVGMERQVDESDIKNLTYLQAIVKETLRLYPALSLSAPRLAMEDCTIAGFYVPEGTELMVNLWKLHRDPSIWSDPLEFKPERFLTSSSTHGDVDVRGQHFELLPFGSGRRIYPGISNSELAKECFTTNDKIFSTRPKSVAVKLMGYNSAMFGFAPYGPYWRELRKIATTELLSNTRLELLKNIRISEINMSVQELYQIWVEKMKGGGGDQVVVGGPPVLVEMGRWFGDLLFNVVVRMIAGKRYFGRRTESDCNDEETRRYQTAMSDFMHLVGIFVVSDAIPFLGFLDLQGYEKKMKRTSVEIDYVLGRWVDEHRRRRQKKKKKVGSDGDDDKINKVDDQQEDFIDVMLSILKDDEHIDIRTYLPARVVLVQSLILGGNDTTSVTLTWALSLLLNNRHVLQKAQDELDIHVGRERQVDESDIKNLRYLQAIVKETLRLYPAAPLSPPRVAMEDCTIAGFHVPKGTQLMLNLWKLHRDPHFWSDPLEFKPERFLTSSSTHGDVDVRGQHFELLPFGSGRRICPGISFALQLLHLTLAQLLHGFHLSTPSDLPVDMTETSGLTCPKATPLDVLLTPRLPSELYYVRFINGELWFIPFFNLV